MFETLQQRLGWAAQRIDMPAGAYEVLLEPSPAADLAISAYWFMTRRDADEGRSPYSKPGGGTRLGERLFGDVTIYSDPDEPGIETTPFHYGVDSGSASSVFDNGVELSRSEWVRDGVLQNLITPRYWAAKTAENRVMPYVNNLVLAGSGPSTNEMIAADGSRAARHLFLVHPHGRSTVGAVDGADARRRVPDRARPGERRRQ